MTKKIYSGRGDSGYTSLRDGTTVKKSSRRVCAYGEIDELNSFLGLLKNKIGKDLQKELESIQEMLFKIGAALASKSPSNLVLDQEVAKLEEFIDRISADLPDSSSFIVPGENERNAHCHIARAICRRAERTVVDLSETETVPESIIAYLNRLGDFLFTLSRKKA